MPAESFTRRVADCAGIDADHAYLVYETPSANIVGAMVTCVPNHDGTEGPIKVLHHGGHGGAAIAFGSAGYR